MIAAEALKRYTPEEFEAMEKDEHCNYELIDGIIMMSPRPAAKHQTVSLQLSMALHQQLKNKDCHVIQEFELVLDRHHFIPDIMITCGDKFEGSRYEKLPQIVIEIVSPSSVSRDCLVKRRKYAQLGIHEYWIVSPEEQCIDVLCFADSSHTNYCVEDNPRLTSCTIPDLTIDLNTVFE